MVTLLKTPVLSKVDYSFVLKLSYRAKEIAELENVWRTYAAFIK